MITIDTIGNLMATWAITEQTLTAYEKKLPTKKNPRGQSSPKDQPAVASRAIFKAKATPSHFQAFAFQPRFSR